MKTLLHYLFRTATRVRQPLKEPPLHVPGQGLEEELRDACFDLALVITIPLAAGLVILLQGAFQVWRRGPDALLEFGLSALLVWGATALVSWSLGRRMAKRVRDLRIGLFAERVVGQQLERCRTLNYSVFHDVVAENGKFNIDHIAVGPGGIFVVETKARSKPKTGDCKAWVEGDVVKFSDGGYNAHPIRQVQANADYVRKLVMRLLSEKKNPVCHFGNGRQLPVIAVIVYPGWFIDFSRKHKDGVILTMQSCLVEDGIRDACPRLDPRESLELGDLLGQYLRERSRGLLEE